MEITRNYSRKLQLLRLETTEFLCGTEVKTQRFHCRGLGSVPGLKWKLLSCVRLFVTPWTIASQIPLSMGILHTRILAWIAMPSLGDLPNPGIEPRSPASLADSLPSEPPGKPKNTGVGSLSCLQGIFPTQELNQGLLHCKRILHHLSYQASPSQSLICFNFSRVFAEALLNFELYFCHQSAY